MSSVNTLLAVKDLMNRDIVKTVKTSKVVEAARMIEAHKVSSVVIVDEDGKMVGIVTDNDIVTKVVSTAKDPAAVSVEQIMTPEIQMIPGASSIFEARAKMAKAGVKHLIVEIEGRPAGLISSTSLLGGS